MKRFHGLLAALALAIAAAWFATPASAANCRLAPYDMAATAIDCTAGPFTLAVDPSAGSNAGVAVIASTSTASSLVAKASACTFYSGSVNAPSAGWLLLYDAAAAPSDGAVTPKAAVQVGANVSASISFTVPAAFSTGCTLVFSSTGPFTQTGATAQIFSAQVK